MTATSTPTTTAPLAGLPVINGLFDVNDDGLIGRRRRPRPVPGRASYAAELLRGAMGSRASCTTSSRWSRTARTAPRPAAPARRRGGRSISTRMPPRRSTWSWPQPAPVPGLPAVRADLERSCRGTTIEITCDIDVVPAGTMDFRMDGPINFSYETDPPQGIDSIHCFGHIGSLNFDIDAGDLPPVFGFDFDPDSSLTVVAGDGFGGPDRVGHVALRLSGRGQPTLPNTEDLFPSRCTTPRPGGRHPQLPRHLGRDVRRRLRRRLRRAAGRRRRRLRRDVRRDRRRPRRPGAAAAERHDKLGLVRGRCLRRQRRPRPARPARLRRTRRRRSRSATWSSARPPAPRPRAPGRCSWPAAASLYLSDVAGAFQDDENLRVGGRALRPDRRHARRPRRRGRRRSTAPRTTDGFQVDYNTDADSGRSSSSTACRCRCPRRSSWRTRCRWPTRRADDYVALHDQDARDRAASGCAAGVFGIDEFLLDTSGSLTCTTTANEPHLLNVTIDREFGGAFFPDDADFDLDLNLVIDAVPQEFDFTTDLATQFIYEASDPITRSRWPALVDDTDDDIDNGVDVTFGMLGLPERGPLRHHPGRGGDHRRPARRERQRRRGRRRRRPARRRRRHRRAARPRTATARRRRRRRHLLRHRRHRRRAGRRRQRRRSTATTTAALAGAEVFASGGINTVAFSSRAGQLRRHLRRGLPRHPGAGHRHPGPVRAQLRRRRGSCWTPATPGRQPATALGEITALVSTTNDDTANAAKLAAVHAHRPGARRPDPRRLRRHRRRRPGRVAHQLLPVPPGDRPALLQRGRGSPTRRASSPASPSSTPTASSSSGATRTTSSSGWRTWRQRRRRRHRLRQLQLQRLPARAPGSPTPTAAQFVFRAPGRGDDPFFAGTRGRRVHHPPDRARPRLDRRGLRQDRARPLRRVSSPGEIDFYRGPGDGTTACSPRTPTTRRGPSCATRPTTSASFWDFSFPNGGAIMDAEQRVRAPVPHPGRQHPHHRRRRSSKTCTSAAGIDILSFDVTDDIDDPEPVRRQLHHPDRLGAVPVPTAASTTTPTT